MCLATGLISIFGLRLSELAELEVRGGKLYVGHIKNNTNTTEQDRATQRRVFAMDLVEKPNLGEKLIQLYKSQLIKLPATVLTQIAKADDEIGYAEVGKTFAKKLKADAKKSEMISKMIIADCKRRQKEHDEWLMKKGMEENLK